MKTVKIILTILSFVLGAAVLVSLVWGLLYLCIPPVKNKTDDIFNGNKTETEAVVGYDFQTNNTVDFENKIIKVEV